MTIYDIAKEAGVSASTVSRVMNNKPGIREETRERVMAIVEKYNFAPDETARGLVRQATKIVGLLVPDVRIANYMMGIHSIIKSMAQLGYCCIVIDTGLEGAERAKYIKILGQRRVEGAILIGSGYQCDEVRNAIETYLKNIPVVMVNSGIDLPNVYSVVIEERRGTKMCFDHIFEKGYKKPIFIGCEDKNSNRSRLEGMADSIAEHCPGLEVPVYLCESPEGCGYESTRQAMLDHPDADVIFYTADCFAVLGISMLQEMGIDVPRKVGVVTGEQSIYSFIRHPYLTSLDTKVEEICDRACETLAAILAGKPAAKTETVAPSLQILETT